MKHLPDVYATININDLALIDFGQVAETSSNTIRKNLANTEFVLKWESTHTPTFITDGSVVAIQTLTYQEAVVLMQTPEWQEEIT